MSLNIFKNVRLNLVTTPTEVYETPIGYTAIILMAQVSNVTPNPASTSMSVISGDQTTFLVLNFPIPGNDAAGLLTGKLVLESGQKIAVSSSNDGSLQMVISILESQN
jgi:hypothetical protein